MSAQAALSLTPNDASTATSSVVPAPRTVVDATGIEKTFGLRPVLRGVSLQLGAGRSMALLGANGAGKTTLLRVLATLIRPSAGTLEVVGWDALRDATQVRRQVGYVGHQPGLYEELTVRENLLFFATMYALRDGAQRADALIARVGLRAKANERVRTLSRGQAQRLALARGILHEPELLLLDEPDTGLDEHAVLLLDELVRERAERGGTTILTTHHLQRGLDLTDQCVVLAGGRVVHVGASHETSAAEVRALFTRKRGVKASAS